MISGYLTLKDIVHGTFSLFDKSLSKQYFGRGGDQYFSLIC